MQPNVLIDTGIVPGAIMIVFFAFITNLASTLLLKCVEKTGESTYENVVFSVLGKGGSFYLAFTMIITMLIANAGHISTVGALFHDLDL